MKSPTKPAIRKYTQDVLAWFEKQPLADNWIVLYHTKSGPKKRAFDDESDARAFAEARKGGLRRVWSIVKTREEIFEDVVIPVPQPAKPPKRTIGVEVEDRKWSRNLGRAVALELIERLAPVCDRIVVAGSIRRGKPLVGDVELLFVPKCHYDKDDAGQIITVSEADAVIEAMLSDGTLAKRLNKRRGTTWGPQNKLAAHLTTGMAVDLFATNERCWWNSLVCRTGGAETNKAIATSAMKLGRRWHVYGQGFTLEDGTDLRAESEEHVFELAGLPYLPPEKRI